MKFSPKNLVRILFFLFSFPAIAASQVATYEQLVKAIRQTRAATVQRIESAVRQEKVREAWETGKLIDEHVLQFKERADYGKRVLDKLAGDLGTSQTELSLMLQFARAYPMNWPANKLSWSHYQALLSLNDPEEREAVAREALNRNWTRDQVREEIRKRKSRSGGSEAETWPTVPLVAKPGKIGTYLVIDWNGKKVYDLGFANFYEIKGPVPEPTNPPAEDLYTYEVQVEDVIDGDTFWANIHLGFGIWTHQKLRLRGLDAPEIESAEGKEAKEFLKKLLSPATRHSSPVMIKTVRSDKYDRYLADVWAGKIYINQELLDKELAVRVND
ncbi:MAG: thermonuclease family protein [Candidatus Omnitrophica bacterium]|nr:thermonuclease family protein [Candidatus Omnitrophota bacterium]